MEEKEKQARAREKQYISQLKSGNTELVINTIQEIREKGRINIIPEIIDLILQPGNTDIQQACTMLLNDLKDKEAIKYIVAALKDEKYKSIFGILLASCWQNGMDYHEHINLFAELFIKSDYIVALEAFTVIEETIAQCEDKQISSVLNKLVSHNETITEDKEALQKALIEVIKSV